MLRKNHYRQALSINTYLKFKLNAGIRAHVRHAHFPGSCNHRADKLATAGARLHAVHPDILKKARCRKKLAQSVQSLMVDILAARANARLQGDLEDCDLDNMDEEDEGDCLLVTACVG